mmetsp:Transcript_19875/g.50802  ORF Transcript_19875/g.50802 Transcript_19875/m.50802 type:complete len:85 (-) Transcript_19875:174-428(-)|eukprot:CAMPEP_0113881170 /NCGR_PEP_ID=MMETSP0780_2-20120614/8215_1 /TAXON_ID=652834 /ORGANISM="Palpitomonas bilix" /LENGTH=84 /DNA_ID=CAMNT_0000867973 /DNA_START=113 /DNA_END=367 /DNA_ORIENTATION=- /assembly_acc=CAM_ASM_000599
MASGQQFSEADIKEAFRTFDRDGNGYIGTSDLKLTFRALNENLSEDEVDEMIRLVDKDGDGQIHLQEFRKLVQDINAGVYSKVA